MNNYILGIDSAYIYLVLPAVLISLLASFNVQRTFAKYQKIMSRRGLTGAQAARNILDMNGLHHVRIERASGRLSDHYDPRGNVIRLSGEVHDSYSIASVGVAAHEAGHAVQYGLGYFPIKIRSVIIPVTQIGSNLSMPLVFIGLFTGFYPLVSIGIILFSVVVLFQIITLPVEFNASGRATEILEKSNILESEEVSGAKKVLFAAALTYVAALLVSVANLLRLLSIGNRRR